MICWCCDCADGRAPQGTSGEERIVTPLRGGVTKRCQLGMADHPFSQHFSSSFSGSDMVLGAQDLTIWTWRHKTLTSRSSQSRCWGWGEDTQTIVPSGVQARKAPGPTKRGHAVLPGQLWKALQKRGRWSGGLREDWLLDRSLKEVVMDHRTCGDVWRHF